MSAVLWEMRGPDVEAGPREPRRSGEMPFIVPNRWQGEADCAVGPFSGRRVATYFADRVVGLRQREACAMRVFARGNAWYVEVRRCGAEPR